MLILGIETSCDDTSVAVVKAADDKIEVLSNIVSSQIVTHAPYGGVVPLLAAREHEKNLPIVLESALKASNYKLEAIDIIAVTSGPGLIMSLVKGVNFAKELSQKYNKPIIGVNHMAGHIYSNWLRPIAMTNDELRMTNVAFPALCLIVSGGHTELVLMRDYEKYELVGRTVDDAAGEAFDKIARLLGLPYPGGPAISAQAEKFQASSTKLQIKLPRPMQYSKDFNFSGLKTAVLYLIRDLTNAPQPPLIYKRGSKGELLLPDEVRSEIAHEAQEAIVDVLIHKTKKAIEKYHPASVLLAGGVSANARLRAELKALSEKLKINVAIPPMEYTTDNAAMIATAGYFASKKYKLDELTPTTLDADANWEIA